MDWRGVTGFDVRACRASHRMREPLTPEDADQTLLLYGVMRDGISESANITTDCPSATGSGMSSRAFDGSESQSESE